MSTLRFVKLLRKLFDRYFLIDLPVSYAKTVKGGSLSALQATLIVSSRLIPSPTVNTTTPRLVFLRTKGESTRQKRQETFYITAYARLSSD